MWIRVMFCMFILSFGNEKKSRNKIEKGIHKLRKSIKKFITHTIHFFQNSLYDCKTIYDVPLLLREQKIHEIISKRLEISPKPPTEASRGLISKWRKVARRSCNGKRKVSIAMIGKYVKLSDAYASVIKALKHAAIAANVSLTIHPVEAEHLEQHNARRISNGKLEEIHRKNCEI